MMNVFTYGSLMYPAVWDQVVRGTYHSVPARLAGWRRLAIAGASYPGAIPDSAAELIGRVWFEIDAADLARLDAFESHEYRRVQVSVRCEEGSPERHVAQIYQFLAVERLLDHDWDQTDFVRNHLADFARRHGAAR